MLKSKFWFCLLLSVVGLGLWQPANVLAQESEGSVGLTATIQSPAPTVGATITVPSNGQSFSSIPIQVSGTCPDGLLIKLFRNNIFGGSAMCSGGSYSMSVDLFIGQNDLVARVYDDLDQAGPDSNTVSVTFNDTAGTGVNRVTLTTNYAKRGANPGDTLTWPILISGGTGPYAISVDWGDGKQPDLISQTNPGAVDLTHIYDSPGVYNIVVRVSDSRGTTAFLQLVGVGNGPLSQTEAEANQNIVIRNKVYVLPVIVLIVLIFVAYFVGKKGEKARIKKSILKGERPF